MKHIQHSLTHLYLACHFPQSLHLVCRQYIPPVEVRSYRLMKGEMVMGSLLNKLHFHWLIASFLPLFEWIEHSVSLKIELRVNVLVILVSLNI